MNRIIILALTLLLSFNSRVLFSQERINKTIPKIGTIIKKQLLKSTGWLLNPEGQWISRTNKIPSFIENEYKSIIDYAENGLGVDNFISYQIRDVTIENKIYLIIIKKFKDGYYKYPSIHQDWKDYNSVIYYVFEKAELDNFNTVILDSINYIKLNVLYSNTIEQINNEQYIYDIQKDIILQIDKSKIDISKNDIDYTIKKTLVFQIAPYKTKNIVQFQIYSIYSYLDYETNSYLNSETIGGILNKNSSFEDSSFLSNELFKKCYFEVDFITFNNFIEIQK